MKSSLGIFNFLDEISSLSYLLFSSISLPCSLRKTFSSFLAILWNSAFRWVYLSHSPLPFTSLLFSAICKASSDNHFAFSFLLGGIVLITASYKINIYIVYILLYIICMLCNEKKDILQYSTKVMDFECIMLSEIYQIKINTVCSHLYMESEK